MRKHLISFAVLLFVYTLNAASTLDDSLFGYTITLPDHWVLEFTDATHHRFIDTSNNYSAIIAIERYDFSAETVFTTADDWTRANFIAYSFFVDADPLSSMLFYDTVSTRTTGLRWATDAYSVFYDAQSSSADIAECIRFTAAGSWGFEIYAIGPLADMNANAGFYFSIIQSIVIREVPRLALRPVSSPIGIHPSAPSPVARNFDLLGRALPHYSKRYVSRVTVAPRTRSCMFR